MKKQETINDYTLNRWKKKIFYLLCLHTYMCQNESRLYIKK
jgi:hypothetical protein